MLGRWCAKTSFPSTRQRVSAYGVLIETSSELADLNLEVSGVVLQVRAAVGDKLPVAVFLGTDVPELGQFLCPDLRKKGSSSHLSLGLEKCSGKN